MKFISLVCHMISRICAENTVKLQQQNPTESPETNGSGRTTVNNALSITHPSAQAYWKNKERISKKKKKNGASK